MKKVKLFKGTEAEVERLEAEVNSWIVETNANVVSITGNMAPQSEKTDAKSGLLGDRTFTASDILIVVTYEDG